MNKERKYPTRDWQTFVAGCASRGWHTDPQYFQDPQRYSIAMSPEVLNSAVREAKSRFSRPFPPLSPEEYLKRLDF